MCKTDNILNNSTLLGIKTLASILLLPVKKQKFNYMTFFSFSTAFIFMYPLILYSSIEHNIIYSPKKSFFDLIS